MASLVVQMTVADLESVVQRALQAALGGKPFSEIASSLASSAKASPSKKEKKPKKERDPDAPKRESNDWIKFTQRARALLKKEGFDTGVEVTQFCGELKEKMPKKSTTDSKGNSKETPDYESLSDEAILSARRAWVKPEHSKQALAGKNKRKESGGSSVAGSEDREESEHSDAESAASGEKKKRQWSPEAKAAAAAKRAAKKAAKASADGEEKKEAPAVVAVTASAPAAKAASPPPAKASAKPAEDEEEEEAEEDIQSFNELEDPAFSGKGYHVNCRGDVVDSEMAWVGKYNFASKKLNKKASKPDDLDL